jgi:biotin carboxylase
MYLMLKKILIISGGQWQVPIAKKAKKLGLIVICTNLYEDSPAFKYADYSYVANVLDKDENLKIAIKHSIDAVITDQSDIAVNTVAYINETLGLNGVDIDTAELFTNKFRMRQELKADDLHHPKYKLCKNIDEVVEFYKNVNADIILKPLDNQSSRGIEFITNIDTINKSFENTMSYSKDNTILAEEFIGGIELTVEGFKYKDSMHKSFAVSKKSYFKNIVGVANSLQYQPTFDEFDINKIKKINNNIFDKLIFGITHVEYKYFNNKFYLIEAAIRGGGTKVSSHITPIVSGYDTNELLIKTAIGEDIQFKEIKYDKQNAILKFFSFDGGIVSNIIGTEIKKDNNILDLELEFKVGDTLAKPIDDRSRVGYFIAYADTLNKLDKIIHNIENSVKVEFE